MSSTASAWARSSRPLRKARNVISPGPAARAPAANASAGCAAPPRCRRGIESPPRPGACNCAVPASPPPAPRRGRCRFAGRARGPRSDGAAARPRAAPERPAGTKSCSNMSVAWGPLILTMPTPPSPGGVAIAAIVSSRLKMPIFNAGVERRPDLTRGSVRMAGRAARRGTGWKPKNGAGGGKRRRERHWRRRRGRRAAAATVPNGTWAAGCDHVAEGYRGRSAARAWKDGCDDGRHGVRCGRRRAAVTTAPRST